MRKHRRIKEDVVSFADYKAKKVGTEEIKDNKTHFFIDSIVFNWVEGPQGDDRFVFNKEFPYPEAQAKIFEEDYKIWSAGDYFGGYDKLGITVNYTENGEKKSANLRVDLGDGKDGADLVDVRLMGESENDVCDNNPVPYLIDEYRKKYGTREENQKKYIEQNTKELPVGENTADKTIDEIEVGDIFYDSDEGSYGHTYYSFFRVKSRTPKSIKVERLKATTIKQPVINNGRIEEVNYYFPTDEVIDSKTYGLDLDKPLRLYTYNKDGKGLCASQGSGAYANSIYAWRGQALKESVETKSTYAKLNEELEKFIEDFPMFEPEDENKEFEALVDKYVPDFGKADTKGGELLRAVCRISYRFYNDGDKAGIGYGKETVNPAVRYLAAQEDECLQDYANALFSVKNDTIYRNIIRELKEFVVDYVQGTNLLNEPNTEDYHDYKTKEDIDDEEW